jgi:hypothetical protein
MAESLALGKTTDAAFKCNEGLGKTREIAGNQDLGEDL